MRARYYNATTLSFLTADPIGFEGGMNWYLYAAGNPLALIDAFGLCPGSPKASSAMAALGGWGWKDYFYDVGQFYMGYGDAAVGTVSGLYHAVTSPVQTATGLYYAATSPVQTANAIYNATVDTWNSGSRGQGQIVGNILIAAGSMGAAKATSVAGNTAKVATSNGGRFLFESWHKATFENRLQSINYHLAKHGNGRTAVQYTSDAMNFYNKNKGLGKSVTLKDGTPGIKIQTKVNGRKTGGYWTQDGRLVTFWD